MDFKDVIFAIFMFIFMFVAFLCIDKKEKVGPWVGYANRNLPDLQGYRDYDECEGINTLIVDGKCQCMPGFPFGDPNGKGCYKCIDQCNKSAKCVYPGKCECEKGLFGDGITECYIPIPFIIDTPPRDLQTAGNEHYTIRIKPIPKFFPLKAYCKFNDTVVKANSSDSHAIHCITPKLQKGTYFVYASFDNQAYSSNYAIVDVYSDAGISFSPLNLIIFIIFMGGILFAYKYIGTGSKKTQADEAAIPFLGKPGKGRAIKRSALDAV